MKTYDIVLFSFLLELFIHVCVSLPYDNSKILIVEAPKQEFEQSIKQSKQRVSEKQIDKDAIAAQNNDVPLEQNGQRVPIMSSSTSEQSTGDFSDRESYALLQDLGVREDEENNYVNNLDYNPDIPEVSVPRDTNVNYPVVPPPLVYLLPPQDSNIIYFDNNQVPIVYPSRRQRSDDYQEYQEYQKQLLHDAIMNNILPTMDPPFYRDSGSYPAIQQTPIPSVPARYDNFVTLFPNKGLRAPTIPILLGCSPYISQMLKLQSSGHYNNLNRK